MAENITKTKGIKLRIEHGRDAGVENAGRKSNLAGSKEELIELGRT